MRMTIEERVRRVKLTHSDRELQKTIKERMKYFRTLYNPETEAIKRSERLSGDDYSIRVR